jgi:DNA-binding PadR family transcriptional regulator
MAIRILCADDQNGFRERSVRNFLDLHVLHLLQEDDRHGYEILQELDERTQTQISPGTLYPLLYELEKEGLIFGRWADPADNTERNRRIYSITEKGQMYRQDSLRNIERLLQSKNIVEEAIITA